MTEAFCIFIFFSIKNTNLVCCAYSGTSVFPGSCRTRGHVALKNTQNTDFKRLQSFLLTLYGELWKKKSHPDEIEQLTSLFGEGCLHDVTLLNYCNNPQNIAGDEMLSSSFRIMDTQPAPPRTSNCSVVLKDGVCRLLSVRNQ